MWRTRAQLELAVVEYVAWFNHVRLHSSLGNRPPAEHEQRHAAALAAAASKGVTESRAGSVTEETSKPLASVPPEQLGSRTAVEVLRRLHPQILFAFSPNLHECAALAPRRIVRRSIVLAQHSGWRVGHAFAWHLSDADIAVSVRTPPRAAACVP